MFVKQEGLIYEVTSVKIHDSRNLSTMCYLELVCGWDYINPDFSDQEGWVSPNRFIEDVQDKSYLVCYDESLKDRLLDDGFTFIDSLPYIHVIRDID